MSEATMHRSSTSQRTRRLKVTVGILTAAASLVVGIVAPQAAEAAATDTVVVTVDGANIAAAAKNVNGLTFKGFGVLSGNSTSSLLMDYKAQHPDTYWQLITTLFGGTNPIMNTVKIEMGNDRNTSTGPEAATMRTRDEYPNVLREPGFQLAADAQTVASGAVHVSILRWQRPVWATTDADQYIWFKNTVLAAYRHDGIMVDSINPDTNETTNPNAALYKTFSGWLRNDTKGYEGTVATDPNNGFASAEEADLFHSIKTIAADTVGTPPVSFGNQLTSTTDPSLRDAVDVLGFHYSSADDANGNLKKLAEQFDKEVWNSEGQSTFSNSADRPNNDNSTEQGGTGTAFGGPNSALEMGNWITTGFSASRRTMSIFQPAIGSFYDGFQYSSKELVSARDPWSGFTYYDGGLDVLAQFTQFANLGWENSDNTAGIWRAIPEASASQLGTGNPPSGARAGGASYTTLAAPDATDFSTVVINDSSFTKTYRVQAKDLSLGADKTVELWETRAADAGQAYDANYLRPVSELAPAADGSYTFTVKPWSALTATTLDHASAAADGSLTPRAGYGNTLPTSKEYTAADGERDVLDTDASGTTNGVTNDSALYADDFDYREEGSISNYDAASGALTDSGQSYLDSRGAEAKPAGTPNVQGEDNGAVPRYSNDTNGAFESVSTADAAHGRVLRQQVGPGMAGGAWNSGDPKTTIGDSRWANYTVSADVSFEAAASGQYATIGAREQGGTPNGQNVSAAELRVDPTGAWSFQRYGTSLASGTAGSIPGLSFKAGTGVWNTVAVQVAGAVYTASINGVTVAAYTDPSPQATGRIQLGSSFSFVDFDNLKVQTVAGYTPYYTDLIDGMHQTSWNNVSTPVLAFDSNWSHVNGQGMFEWQRTASNSTAQGASLTYSFTGTGLDIIGTNSGKPTLDVVVDGVAVAIGAPTLNAASERTAFTLRGLANGPHTVVLKTASADVINVDAVGVVTATADSSKVDTAALTSAVENAASLQQNDYDQASWSRVSVALASARAAVANPTAFGLDTEGAAAITARLASAVGALVPKDVSADVRDLGTVTVAASDRLLPATLPFDGTELPVTWSAASTTSVASAAELASVAATGRTTQKLSSGVYQRFSATVVVVPADLAYFIDSGSAGSAPDSVFGAVRAATPGLLNASSDQKWDGSASGATWGYSTTASASAAGTPSDWGSSYVGADFNKPVTYHLSLPAGSYNVVAVQAPRAGLTTNVYSKVGVRGTAGTGTTQTAVSTGAATSVTQKATLESPAVLDLEFGTNGTSGYNARLALVYVQVLPRDAGVQGTLGATDALPASIDLAGVQTPVTWDEGSSTKARTDYAKLTLSGRVTATNAPILAGYEVVPAGLTYFIDSGTNGVDSPEYSAVRKAVATLKNDRVDQVSTAPDQWGYVATGMVTKSGTDIADKNSTGLYQNTTTLTYHLPLDAGTYNLTGGFTEWWGLNRTMNHTVSVGGTELAKGNIPLSASSTPLTAGLTFTLATPATVDYVVTNEGAGSEKPVISWLAVADVTEVPPNDSATAAPGTAVLSSNDGWDTGLKDGTFQLSMNLWWGSNGSLFTLYRDGTRVGSVPLTSATPGAQKAVVDITGLKNGTYTFTGRLVNSKGSTATQPLTVTVTNASPGTPVLSSDNGDGDGSYTVTANLWWGTNATSYRFLENGTEVAAGALTAASPAAQRAALPVAGKPKGTYAYTVEFTDAAGTTTSAPLAVTVR